MLVVDGVDMVDVREAAQLAQRTPETVRRWVWSGRLSATRHGNRLLIARQALDDLLAGTAAPRADMTLQAWANRAAQERTGFERTETKGRSAADLVLDDRRGRSGEGGHDAGR